MVKGSKVSGAERKAAKIVQIGFCDATNKMLFFIKRPGSKRLLIKTAAELVLDTKLLRLLRECDVWCACYAAGDEHATAVNSQINKTKEIAVF